MYIIEDKGKVNFYEGERNLSIQEGFARLERIYSNEPSETKRIIDELKKKYLLKPMK